MIQPVQYQTVASVGGSATATASFTTTPTKGNLVIVAICSGGPNSPATGITDNQTGNSYSQAGSTQSTTNGQRLQIFYAPNVNASGTFTITVTFSGATVSADIALLEYNDMDPNPFLSAVGTTGSSATPASGSLSPNAPNALVFSAVVDENVDGTSISAGSGFVIRQTQLVISTRDRIGTEDKIQGDGSAVNPSFILGASSTWACASVAFKPKSVSAFNRYKAIMVGDGMSRSESAT